eukprot:jgi/Undpi1/14206/HiC_scaffold_9.g03855.m1
MLAAMRSATDPKESRSPSAPSGKEARGNRHCWGRVAVRLQGRAYSVASLHSSEGCHGGEISSTRRSLMQTDVEAHRGARRASRPTAAIIEHVLELNNISASSISISERKRPASDQKLDITAEKGRPQLPIEGEKDSSKAPVTVPVEVLDTVLEFVDGNGLLACEGVSYRWRLATDRTFLWKRACLSAFPHLGDYHFESAYASCSAYEGDWREVFLDGNRESRSTVLDWKMEAVGRGNGVNALAGGDANESERIYFSPFSLCGYSFSLIADPGGNPRAANQAQAAGAPRVEKGLSVYLTVEFQNGLPDTPLWGGGFLSHPEFPPPPLQVGPGHPWLGTGEGGINGEGSSGGGGDGGGLEGSLMVAGPEGRLVPRDPHGLRRRRRRYRMREGRIKGISQVRDPSVIERGCCAAFSLSAVNQAGLKDVMWVSSMDDDRFFPGRSSWGVHCLLPTSKIQDPDAGFLKDGSITVRLRLRLLFLTAHVYTTADLASHRGFGVVPVRGEEQPYHYHGYGEVNTRKGRKENHRNMPWNAGYSRQGFPHTSKTVGPLPCLTFEVLRCATVEEMEKLVAMALDVPSTNDIRLWLITQPLTDAPLAPRQLLSGKGRTTGLSDGVHESPSLVRLLSSDTLDDTCRVRLWVEQRSDGGFWEVERDPPRWQPLARPGPRCGAAAIAAAVKVAASPQAPATSTPTSPKPPKESFAGVRLSCTADMPPWEMRSALGWGPRAWSPADPGPPGATGGVAVAPTPGNANDVEVLLSSAAVVPGGGEEQQPENAAAVGGVQSGTAGGGGGLSPVRRRREERILVFLKTLGLSGGGGGVGKGSRGGVRGKGGDYGGTGDSGSSDGGRDGEGGAVYLTHAVLRKTSPLRSLFELAAEIFPQCVAAEELGAYVEELPCMWQGVPVEAFGSEAFPFGPQDEGKGSARGSSSNSSSGSDPQSPPPPPRAERAVKGSSGAGVSKRFFSCPPPLLSPPLSSKPSPERHGVSPETGAGRGGVRGSGSDGMVIDSTSVKPKHASAAAAVAAATRAAVSVSGAAAACGSVFASSAASTVPAASSAGRGKRLGSFDDDSDNNDDGGGCRNGEKENRLLTLEDAGLQAGASICFFRVGCGGRGRASVLRTYTGIAEELVEGVRELLQRRGPLGRVHLLKLPEVVEICESLGYQGFRARIAHEQQQHVNARQTLEYVARGRHLAFICDSCGTQDFSGPRYHCLSCPDYDLCLKCNDKPEPAPRHRYIFADGHWKRESGFLGHSDAHELEEIMTVPAKGFDWRT